MSFSLAGSALVISMVALLASASLAADAGKRDTGTTSGSSGGKRPLPQPKATAGERPAPGTPETPPPEPEEEPHGPLAWVVLDTSMGDIVLELNREKAPISVENFLNYVETDFYDGLIFHRVMSTFMIQGGGFAQDMQQKRPNAPIKNEWRNGLKNERGTIAMARTSIADSATSQFFINVKDNAMLDEPRDGAAYAVFGKVVAGMDVVDRIKDVPVRRVGPHENVPVDPVIIEDARNLTEEEAKQAIEAEKEKRAESDETD